MEELENIGCIKAGEMHGGRYDKYFEENRRVYSSEGLSPTAHTAGGVGQELKVMEQPVSCASRGRPNKDGANQQKIEPNGANANSITTVPKDSMVCEPSKEEKKYRTRALTERECFRLMGVKEEDYQKIASHQSRSSQTHLAGDSIVTTCLMAIFGEMFENVDYRQKIEEVAESVREEKTNV